MADYKNIPLGLRTQTQIPLDVKEYIQNESLLSNLGVNGQLAYTYTKGLVVYCIEESTRWEWTEVKSGLEDTGLINQDFIYSDNHIAFGIDYSNKRYNFFPYNQSTFTVPDATTTIKGILKLANDLGGTADAPTTPTALHKTDNESFTGIKSSTNTGDTQVNGLSLTNDGTGDSTSLYINNTAGGKGVDILNANGYGQYITNTNSGYGLGITNSLSGGGIFIDNLATGIGNIIANNAAGTGIYISNNSSGKGLEVFTYGTGRGINVNGTLGSTAFSYVGQSNGTNTFTVDKLGNIVANTFVRTGGTAQQILLANGTVEETNKQKVLVYPTDFTGTNYTLTNADNNYEIIVDNGITAVTITVPSGLTSKIGVGFTQKGTGDISYTASGTTINNPIGLKIKGQFYQTYLSQELATNIFYLGGNTKL